jgi:hypothetical protein
MCPGARGEGISLAVVDAKFAAADEEMILRFAGEGGRSSRPRRSRRAGRGAVRALLDMGITCTRFLEIGLRRAIRWETSQIKQASALDAAGIAARIREFFVNGTQYPVPDKMTEFVKINGDRTAPIKNGKRAAG